MKRFPLLLIALFLFGMFACKMDNSNTWTNYETWRNDNVKWLEAQKQKKNADGTDYYTKLTASWDEQAYVYIKYLNDTMLTKDNMKPLYTSTIDVKYIGHRYDNVAFDSSYLSISPADSVFRTPLNKVIGGWAIALQSMHIGDSCEIVIPYQQAYGNQLKGNGIIKPYSVLKFGIKLVGIPGYEIPVN
ncbi:MAG: FKBP-type peptidyl-prolyl cis-trans isomerase [Muribaculaceae bacterium]